MPRVNIYIREEDIEKWSQIDNKSEWVSDKLNEKLAEPFRPAMSKEALDMPIFNEPELLKEQVAKAFQGKELKKCKNGHYIPDGRHKCLEKGCKYS